MTHFYVSGGVLLSSSSSDTYSDTSSSSDDDDQYVPQACPGNITMMLTLYTIH